MKKTLLFLLICLPFISHAQEGTLTNIQVSQRADGTNEAGHKSEDESLLSDNLKESDTFFKVYPNPTKDKFTLELYNYEHATDITVEVYGMRGELIKRRELEANKQHVLSLEGQQPGMYIIRVMKGDKVGVERLIFK